MADRFRHEFDRWARLVRRRLLLRAALSFASAGWAAGSLLAVAAWATGAASLARVAVALAVLAPLGGLFVATRRRWIDRDVALFLDARLGADEAVSTAVGIGVDDPARGAVLARASAALERASAAAVRPAMARRGHVIAPLGLAAMVAVAVAPPRARASAARAPGSDVVHAESVPGLVRVEHVRELAASTPAQRERLEHIAEDARRLREQLQQGGLERREALARVAELRERIAAERMAFASPEQRRGLESAMQRLQSAGMGEAARALGDHDPEALDRAMEREANQREAADRQRAHQALADAEAAAQREGADDVARALREQRERMAAREARDEVLRRLAEAMSGDAQVAAALQRFEREGTDEAARELARTMANAMGALTPEQRRLLAERLRQSAGGSSSGGGSNGAQGSQGEQGSQGSQGGSGRPDANATLRALANALEGRSQGGGGGSSQGGGSQGSSGASGDVGSAMSQLPQGPGAMQSGGGAMGSGLGDAEDGARSAEQQLGGGEGDGQVGSSSQGAGGQRGAGGRSGTGGGSGAQGGGNGSQGAGGQSGTGSGNGSQSGSGGQGGEGGTGGGGGGAHGGGTAPIAGGETIRAHAHATTNAGAPMPGGTTTMAPGRAGQTANVRGTGDLQSVAPAEIQGVESSQVPAEYRDQVRQYFRP